MALQANDILKVVLSIAMPDSVIAQNIFWVLFEADGGSVDTVDVLDDLETWVEDIYTNLLNAIADNNSLEDIKVYVYDSVDDDFDEVGIEPVAVTFTDTAQYLAHGLAAYMTARTVDPDVYGRKFIPGMTEAVNDDGYIASGYAGNLANWSIDWTDPFTGAATGSGFIPGVYSFTRSNFYAFTGASTVSLLWGYQRRRKPGVGI